MTSRTDTVMDTRGTCFMFILVSNMCFCFSFLITHIFYINYKVVLYVSGRHSDHLRAGIPSRYVTSQPRQFSLAIPLPIGAISILVASATTRKETASSA